MTTEDTKSESREDTKSESREDTKSESREDTKFESREDTKSENLPILIDAVARWDAQKKQVRYYAQGSITDQWIEVTSEEFANLTRAHMQDSIGAICQHIDETLDRLNTAMDTFTTFRKTMEEMYEQQRVPNRDEEKEN